jgi:hypothetical protein
MKMKTNIFTIALLALVIVFFFAVGPILVIWSMNTLFPVLAIPYTFWTWLSVVLLGAFFRANVSIKRKD